MKIREWLDDLGMRRYSWWNRNPWYLQDIYYEIRNRFFAKYYLLDIKAMPRGAWWDCDKRLFHGVFQILVNYVEQEKSTTYWWDINAADCPPTIREWHLTPRWKRWWNRAEWNARLGVANLEDEGTMDDPNSPHYHEHCEGQAENARQTLALYLWYTVERPKRPEPFGAHNKPEYAHVDPFGNKTNEWFDPSTTDEHSALMNEFTEEYGEYLDKGGALSEQYEEEDTRKAQEVLAIRRSLWT